MRRRCMDECKLSSNKTFYFCPTLPWFLKFADEIFIDENGQEASKTSEQENRYLNYDVCGPKKTDEDGNPIQITAHGFTCSSECKKADENTKSVMKISDEFPYVCEINKTIDSIIQGNNESMLCKNGKCPEDADYFSKLFIL